MADWKDVVKNAVYEALCAAFSLSPSSGEALARFVPAYMDNDTTPQAKRNVDVCYIYTELQQGTQFNYIHPEINAMGKIVMKKKIPVSVTLYFYGPNAYKDSEFFWSFFLYDYGVRSPRAVLRNLNIVPTAYPERPTTLTEDEGTYKRLRADLVLPLQYYEESTLSHEVGIVEHAPELTVGSAAELNIVT